MRRADVEGLIARTLAERFTSSTGFRNPAWTPHEPDGPGNQPYLPRSMDERVESPPIEVAMAADGDVYLRRPSCAEIAELLAPVVIAALSAPADRA